MAFITRSILLFISKRTIVSFSGAGKKRTLCEKSHDTATPEQQNHFKIALNMKRKQRASDMSGNVFLRQERPHIKKQNEGPWDRILPC